MKTLRRDLGLQLLLIYLLFVGPILLAALFFDRLASQRLEADVKAADLSLARAIAQETNATTENVLTAAGMLGTYPAVIQADKKGMEEIFSTLFNGLPIANLIYRLDANGKVVYHFPPGPISTVGQDYSNRDYFIRAKQTNQPFMSNGRFSPTTQQPVSTAVMPLWSDDGHFLGLVGINLKLQTLSKTLSNIATEHQPNETFDVLILDQAGQVVAHPWPPLLLKNLGQDLPDIASAVLSGKTDSRVAIASNGRETLYTYVPIPSAGWGVIVTRLTSRAFTTARATHQGVLFISAFFIIVGLFFWVALSRRVLRPLENMAVFSQAIGLEVEIPPKQRTAMNLLAKRLDQIGHLIRSLLRMEQDVDARLKELSTLLETSAAVVSTLDPQTVLDRILEQVEKLLEVEKCAIVALDEKRGVFRIQASRGLSKEFTEHMAITTSEQQSVALRAIQTRQPVQVSDTEKEGNIDTRPRARAEGYRSVFAMPLLTQHAPPAALLVYRPDPHVFTQSEINLLSSFANHATMAIENAALYARSDMRLREQTRRLEALIQSMQDGLILENLQDCIVYANRRIAELVDLPIEELVGMYESQFIKRLLAKTDETDLEQNLQNKAAIQAALTGTGSRQVEISLQSFHPVRTISLRVFDVTTSEGTKIGRGQILRDITESKEIDRMKSSLITTVSHELRTPLAAIKGYATTLLADDVKWDSLTEREFLSIISNETDHLSQLVNDLMDMSRLEAGNLKVSRIECSLEELVNRAAERAYPKPESRLQVDLPPSLPTINVDPQRMEAVLRNLIENATKYAGDDSIIRVSAEVVGNNLIVRVEDEGPGIPPEYNERIFETFFRLETGLTRSTTGAGVGLSICQGFVRLHGGEIWLEPRQRGTCIAFSIPLDTSISVSNPSKESLA